MTALSTRSISEDKPHVRVYENLIQGSDEWFQVRCGLLTASEFSKIVTKKEFKQANNDTSRAHMTELLAQRINEYVEPSYIGDDMLRGHEDEGEARFIYDEHYEPVEEVGFITNSKWGFTLGYSPDGLVGDKGLIEVKSRRQKFQMQSIINDEVPIEFIPQIQAGMMIAEREWCDFISYCGGMHMYTKRVHADEEIQNALLEAAAGFEAKLKEAQLTYEKRINSKEMRLIPTERLIHQEIHI